MAELRTIAMLPPERRSTALVVGCGPSLVESPPARQPGSFVVACNRAIEAVPADYWLWVDRLHYERSKGHANARGAVRVGSAEHARHCDAETALFLCAEEPREPDELLLHGGTLTAAAHFAVRLGATTVVFVACDAWGPERDRYHAWDGAALSREARVEHQLHLLRTGEGIHRLAAAHPGVAFRDATRGPRHLGLPGAEWPCEAAPSPLRRDPSLPIGYGRLAGVTTVDPAHAMLWFEDCGGVIRAVQVRASDLEIQAQSKIERS